MHWKTRLLHQQALAPDGFCSLAPTVQRGSTVLFGSQAEVHEHWQADHYGYAYGLFGSPTVLELGARIAMLEGARHSFVVPSGLAAITLIYLACCKAGDHVLLPGSAYGPNTALGRFLADFAIEVEHYDPLIGADIDALIRERTALVWTESPGSISMEIQDVPAIVEAAHARGVPVALDNTYAAGVLFDAFAAGVDLSTQALTKYVGGHSDLLLGSVSVRDEALYQRVGRAWHLFGMGVSPDDAERALRGLQTLALRLAHVERSALALARWLQARPEIARVLHPALPDCAGHAIWQRDFSGSAGLFSVVFRADIDAAAVAAFADALRCFGAGFSWGGTHALVMTYPRRRDLVRRYGGELLRLSVGLEQPDDLIADLEGGFARLHEQVAGAR